ncbi:glycosyltransferase [Agarivorans sp. TSD2052]|uniref:glycosyltransferase n=1 Tax=Agarivorans sp. TSD2052 TaxID=2937286 RepID=UPI00200C45F1|nr:glycosyltransferase [Agarivorans sp. TSD2052]UPW20062.1 glycosyltransferase [Agarivorans sp. TSD2052]
MKISIVTPSFKRLDYFEATIDSIVNQEGDFELEYIVQDGGGDERIASFLERKATQIKLKNKKVDFKYFIEKDDGMYSAINRAFARSTGDILAWLNTDDMYHPFALSTVHEVFSKNEDVDWITGIPNSYNMRGQRVGFDSFPNSYSRKFIRAGYYDVQNLDCGLNWIQQESTFWRRSLWNKAGPLNENLKLAADFHLWQRFAKYTDLVKVYSFLGGFRNHDNQLTNAPEKYKSEMPIVHVPAGLRELKMALDTEHNAKEKYLAFSDESMQRLTERFGLLRKDLCGRIVKWSHEKNEWQVFWEVIQ